MAYVNLQDLPEEMLEHLTSVAMHTIELFKLLLPDADPSVISILATSAVNRIFQQMDSSFKWNLVIRPRDEV